MALLKVGALVIKQLTKPLAKRAKTHAKNSPFFAAQCVRVGNAVNVVTHRMNVTLLGGRLLKVKPLEDAVAVDRGAEVLSEGLIISVGTALILLEYARKDAEAVRKEVARKEKEMRQERLRQLELDARFAEMRQELLEVKKELEDRRSASSRSMDSPSTPSSTSSSWFFWRTE